MRTTKMRCASAETWRRKAERNRLIPLVNIDTIKYLGEGHDYERVPDFGMVKVRKEEREMREMRSGSRCLRVTIVTSERQPPGSTA